MNEELDRIKEIEQTKAQMYNRLNGVYDAIDMKTGLIYAGMSAVFNLLTPYLEKEARRKGLI